MIPDCLSKIQEMAYLHLSVHCEKCGIDFEVNEEASEPVEEWAQRVAEGAVEQGWSCLNDGTIICSKCRNNE
jgi:hypothetical protein